MRATFIAATALLLMVLAPASADTLSLGIAAAPQDVSAQNRRRSRVTVRPRRFDNGDRPLFTSDRRECRAVFEERMIPQWGGRVLYAGQSCRWVR